MSKPTLSVLLALTAAGAATGPAVPGSRPAAAIEFVGSTPCGGAVRRFLAIDKTTCEQVTWELALGSRSGADSAFDLVARYHLPVPESPNHLDAGTALQLRGVWSSTPGSAPHPGRTKYTLTAEGRSLQLVLLERDLLQLLTAENRLMVGNAGWSYTLNRRDASPARAVRRMEALDSTPRGLAGAFEGRTPCQEISRVIDLAVDAGCTKLKWRLTLFQDDATGRPTTYKHEGTLYRDGALYGAAPRTGTWSVLRDSSSGELIYRLDRGEPNEYLLLVRADENVLFFLDEEGTALVGNRSHSYTLNRAPHRTGAIDDQRAVGAGPISRHD